MEAPPSTLERLVRSLLGTPGARRALACLEIHPSLLEAAGEGPLPRALLAMALNVLLFQDLLRRVPAAELHVEESLRQGRKVCFDHGALRTVAAPGPLPSGHLAFARILEPLGYAVRGVYPLDHLSMTGHAYAHLDLPGAIPQFFVSELHPERFSALFQAAVERLAASARDPLEPEARALLERLSLEGALPFPEALRLLPELLACFGRHHGLQDLQDYELMLAESAEMAWISTEGNAFNHGTDRVPDVEALAREQKRLGRPMKDAVEVSGSGRVLQTAYRAAQVERPFIGPGGTLILRRVPGSFFEFITRKESPQGLDLGFDAGNAQAIFRMTAPGGGEAWC